MPRTKKTTTAKPKTRTKTKVAPAPVTRIAEIDTEIQAKQEEIKKLKAERRKIEKTLASAELVELQALLKKNHKSVADVK